MRSKQPESSRIWLQLDSMQEAAAEREELTFTTYGRRHRFPWVLMRVMSGTTKKAVGTASADAPGLGAAAGDVWVLHACRII